MNLTTKDRLYLRELAKQQRELAEDEHNKKLEERWYKHNDYKGGGVLAVVEYESFYKDVAPKLVCETELGRSFEKPIKDLIMTRELFGDDRVIPNFNSIFLQYSYLEYGQDQQRTVLYDENNNEQGFQYEHIVKDISKDLSLLSPSVYTQKLDATRELAAISNDVLGDILPAKIRNDSVLWRACLTYQVVKIMGMENLFISMYDYPDKVHQLLDFVTSDVINFMKWQEGYGLLTPNWGNEHAGSNSFGFTENLPKTDVKNDNLLVGKTDITLKDQWINTNSQEMVGISKEMFTDFFLPYYQRLCSNFGAVYYGCCEPVDGIYTDGLDTIENIRKLSVSPWCNEKSISEQIKGKEIVYSRKPSPNLIGVQKEFELEQYKQHIDTTINIAKDLELEFIFRDIYKLHGNVAKVKTAVQYIQQQN